MYVLKPVFSGLDFNTACFFSTTNFMSVTNQWKSSKTIDILTLIYFLFLSSCSKIFNWRKWDTFITVHYDNFTGKNNGLQVEMTLVKLIYCLVVCIINNFICRTSKLCQIAIDNLVFICLCLILRCKFSSLYWKMILCVCVCV